ncbi:isocitrate/isopropylmalate family dehydrogenase [Streptomyces sp. NPDC059894]|uniref:isocitrate/isopropylmalate family dehydrogenase n=1 Tax=unclassified Streptomyces TaxID=2593676 RepID=UPI0036640402
MIDDDGLERLKDFDAIYFGAVGRPTVPDHISLWGLRLRICQNFDQWANVRPVHFLPGITSPLRKADDAELGALAGSLGLAASANLNPERRFPSMFEPVHGSAPDIAGQGLANPIGAVGSAALMLEHFGLPEQAARLHRAIEATTSAGVLTRDVGGTASTEDVTKALIDALNG